MKHICPVCGYPDLEDPPWDENGGASDEICHSCGIHFGYDDDPYASGSKGTKEEVYQRWRNVWISKGKFWSTGIKPPENWDPVEQLKNIGIELNTSAGESTTREISPESDLFPCPCCGYLTIEEPGEWEICSVCFWEDDSVQERDPDFSGGANDLSLNQSRENFLRIGAVEERFLKDVRPPKPEEIPLKLKK